MWVCDLTHSVDLLYHLTTELHELQELGIMNFKHHVDPFTTETIEFMLQSLPISNTPIYRSSTSCLRMTKGHTLTISDVSYTIVDKLKGGFASVYIVASADGSKKALKVQNVVLTLYCIFVF